MSHIRFVRRSVSVALAITSSVVGFLLCSTPASALVVHPIGGDTSSAPSQPLPFVPTPVHTLVVGGMAAWQISLIAAGAAILTATVAVFIDRARAAHRGVKVSAA